MIRLEMEVSTTNSLSISWKRALGQKKKYFVSLYVSRHNVFLSPAKKTEYLPGFPHIDHDYVVFVGALRYSEARVD